MKDPEVDVCRFCGDPRECDAACEVDRIRQEQRNELGALLEESRARKVYMHTERQREEDDLMCDLLSPSPLFDAMTKHVTTYYNRTWR